MSAANPHARLAAALKPLAGDRMRFLAQAHAATAVDRGVIARALAGRKVNPSAYLKLCAFAAVEPAGCAVVGGPIVIPGDVVRWFFALAIRGARMRNAHSQRAACAGQDFSVATLCRAEAGAKISTESYLALCRYAELSPLHACDQRAAPCFTGNTNCNTLESLGATA